jgi:hypothetical protein
MRDRSCRYGKDIDAPLDTEIKPRKTKQGKRDSTVFPYFMSRYLFLFNNEPIFINEKKIICRMHFKPFVGKHDISQAFLSEFLSCLGIVAKKSDLLAIVTSDYLRPSHNS